jgi:hypothetical protein
VVLVMAGPGDQGSADASAGGYLRASHAEREQVVAVLKAAFVQGMLTKEELDARVGQAFASRTRGELAGLTADLPAGPIAAAPRSKTVPAQASPPANKALLWGSWVMVLLAIGLVLGAFPADSLGALTVGVLSLLMAVPVAGALTLDVWREKRSHGRLPPGPARPGQGLERERDSATGDDLILCQARRASAGLCA